MKFFILKETKTDIRKVLKPSILCKLKKKIENIEFVIQNDSFSEVSDDEYTKLGMQVSNQFAEVSVFIGLNEIESQNLIPNKSYFFLNEDLNHPEIKHFSDLQKFYGLVSTYTSFQAFGAKYELFKLPKIDSFSDKIALFYYLKRIVLPPIKIVVFGNSDFNAGSIEVMKTLKIKEVSIENFLTKNYSQAVFTICNDFQNETPINTSNCLKFSKVSDIFIFGNFDKKEKQTIFSKEILHDNNCKLKVIVDATNSKKTLECSLQNSSIENPFYGYLAIENKVVDVFHPAAIAVSTIKNWHWQLPNLVSEEIVLAFLEQIISAFLKEDKEGNSQKSSVTLNKKTSCGF